MSERQWIEEIVKLTKVSNSRWLTHGPGDDCAILKVPKKGREQVVTTDFLLEDTHFTLATHRPAEVGYKCVARALSDLAAMGAVPTVGFISLAVSSDQKLPWVKKFYEGVREASHPFGLEIGGGDLTKYKSVIVDVMLLGEVASGKAMLRSSARPGDVIYVTGPLGGSSSGLEKKSGAAWKRHKRPEPRVQQGQELVRRGVKCAMDISDGLALDLTRLAEASDLSANVDFVPTFRGASEEQALGGGEDYELLFTAPVNVKIPLSLGIPVGAMHRGPAGMVTLRRKPLSPKGWDPFSKAAAR
jgi:thiamine-monophosphate kinase